MDRRRPSFWPNPLASPPDSPVHLADGLEKLAGIDCTVDNADFFLSCSVQI
jgi:hypothetical protein